MIGPNPWPRKYAGVGSTVIEFHSEIWRIQSAAPVDDVGEIEPKTSSWRNHHGPITSMNSAKAATAARTVIGGPVVDPRPRAAAAAVAQEPQPVGQPDERDRAGDEDAVVAGERRQAGE